MRLGGTRQRALLAALLIDVNQMVPTSRLIEELFGLEVTHVTENRLQAGISRLRRSLEDGETADAEPVLVTRPGGYLLRVDVDQFDVAQFERLFQEGREALARNEPELAATLLRRALSLWRGPAFADLALVEVAQAEIRRLDDLRSAAVMERLDADLELGASAELVPELEALVAAHPSSGRAVGQLMLALYRSDSQADALAVYRNHARGLRDDLGLAPAPALVELERQILRHDPALAPRARVALTDAGTVGTAVCPYKGLASFETRDAEYFCGREREVANLITRVASARLVGIVGASGSGKSSLLRAGLLAALTGGALPGSERWQIELLRPGGHPVKALESAVEGTDPGRRLVVAVDQFEEVFTTCADEGERVRFMTTLADLALRAEQGAVVVIAVRADFYGHCGLQEEFARLLSMDHLLVAPMHPEDVSRAIEVPANRVGLTVESELTNALVEDVGDAPGMLPLLSTTMLHLWSGREDGVLRLERYREFGGVRAAVSRLAERAYGQLTDAEKRAAREIMLRLVAAEEHTVTRRRAPLAELDLDDQPSRERALAVLTEARLVTVSDDAVELSHEALLEEWPRLERWIDDNRAGQRVLLHLAAAAREWDQRGRDSSELYRGARLAAALDWASQNASDVSRLERAFLDSASEFSQQRLRHEQRQNRRLRSVVAALGIILAVAAVAAVIALAQRRTAQAEARTALAGQLGAEALSAPRIDQAMLLAREAVNLDPSQQTDGALLASLLRSPAALATYTVPLNARPQRVAVSPDGRTLMVVDNHGLLRSFDTRTRRIVGTPIPTAQSDSPPLFFGDGTRLVTIEVRNGVPLMRVRDARTMRIVRTLVFTKSQLPFARTNGFTITPNGRWLAFAYYGPGGAHLIRWDTSTGHRSTFPLGADDLIALGYASDGRLVTATGTEIATWAAGSMHRLHTVHRRQAIGPDDIAIVSPTGHSIAYGQAPGLVAIVDTSTGRQRTAADTDGQEPTVFSPDGRVLISSGPDYQLIESNAATGTLIQTLGGHANSVSSAAFSRDGHTLYSASLDGVVFEWDVTGARRFGHPFTVGTLAPADPTELAAPLAVSPNGTTAAVRAGRRGIDLVSIPSLSERPLTAGAGAGAITAIAWSPTGNVIAVAGSAGRVELWNEDGSRLGSLRGISAGVQAVAFSPDGHQLAAVDSVGGVGGEATETDGHLALWDVDTARPLVIRDLHQSGWSLAYSRDGTQLAIGLEDGHVLLLDPHTGTRSAPSRPAAGCQ